MGCLRRLLLAGFLALPTAWAQAPDPLQLAASPTHAQQLPLYRAVMAQPFNAPYLSLIHI